VRLPLEPLVGRCRAADLGEQDARHLPAADNRQGLIASVRQIWRFDPDFSAYAIQGLDSDGDGVLSGTELQPLAKVNVESLKEFDFFTFLTIGDNELDFAPPKEY